MQYRNIASIDNYGLNAGYEGSALRGRLRYVVNVTEALARRVEKYAARSGAAVFGNARVSYAFEARAPRLPSPRTTWRADRRSRVRRSVRSSARRSAARGIRATLSGAVPGWRALSYRLSANYVTTDRGAYVVGPNSTGERHVRRAYALPRSAVVAGCSTTFRRNMAVRTILIIGVMTAAAAGCLDVTSVEVAPPMRVSPRCRAVPRVHVSRELAEQPGCSESFSACSQNDACLSAYLCSVDKAAMREQDAAHFVRMPCASEAGIASLNDPRSRSRRRSSSACRALRAGVLPQPVTRCHGETQRGPLHGPDGATARRRGRERRDRRVAPRSPS